MRLIITVLFIIINISAYAKGGDVTEYSLPNDLKLFVKEDHRAPIAIVQVWYKVGSSYESPGHTGTSHALEHMMFRGTEKYGQGVLNKILSDNGASHNAFTTEDFTVYHETLPVDKLSIVFDLEADRMQKLLLDEVAFAKERQVITEERKMRIEDNPNSLTYERFSAAAFVYSPYRSPIIGSMQDIQNLTHEDLRLWYKNWYAPNNAIIVVVGDVQPDEVFALVRQYFGKLPQVNVVKPKPQKGIESLGECRIIVKAPAKLPFLIMGYNVPTLKTVDQKWKVYALDIAKSILSGGASARLDKDLVRKQLVAVSVGASYDPYSRLDNLFVLSGTPAPGYTVQELEAGLTQEIKKLQITLVTSKELERVKAQVVSEKIYDKDSIEFQAKEIGSLEAVGISWKESEQYVENINAVTPEQVQQVAKEYLIPDRLTVAELQPIQLADDDSFEQPQVDNNKNNEL